MEEYDNIKTIVFIIWIDSPSTSNWQIEQLTMGPEPDKSTTDVQQQCQQESQQPQPPIQRPTQQHQPLQSQNSHKRPIASDHDSVASSIKTQNSYRKNVKRKKRKKYIMVDGSDNSNGNKKKYSFMNELFQGVLIYALCVTTPVILGVILKWYENFYVFQFASQSAGSNEYTDDYYDGHDETSGNGNINNRNMNLFSSLVSSFSSDQIFNTITKIILNSNIQNSINNKFNSFLSSYSRDVQFIIVATVLQSLVRVILVHLLVPRYLVPRRLVALVRNKSSHLLSGSAYEWKNQEQQPTMKQSLSRKELFVNYMSDTLEHTGDSLRRSLGHEAQDGISPIRENKKRINSHIGGSDFPMQQNLPLSPLSSMEDFEFDHLDTTQALRLFSAPRYATAMFRLLCCLISCLWAISHFRQASYWPVWVGGSIGGNTKYCWDLSGTVDHSFVLKQGLQKHQKDDNFWNQHNQYERNNSFGYNDVRSSLDGDFDNQNFALRYFFLGQASYQLQSLCFHFLSMLLLFSSGMKRKLKGGVDGGREEVIISARSSFKSYLRPVLEHSMYFVLTIAIFFFSGSRRLGSIVVFALEFSSLVLQLLQICINAPESSRLRNPRVIKFVHHYLAIPVFVYCRFFIMPFVVQYSALFESTVWLKQIDHAFVPGCGVLIYFFFNGTLILALVLNFVYLKRLIFHPYISNINKNE